MYDFVVVGKRSVAVGRCSGIDANEVWKVLGHCNSYRGLCTPSIYYSDLPTTVSDLSDRSPPLKTSKELAVTGDNSVYLKIATYIA